MLALLRVNFTQVSDERRPFCHRPAFFLFFNTIISLSVVKKKDVDLNCAVKPTFWRQNRMYCRIQINVLFFHDICLFFTVLSPVYLMP